MMLCQMSPHKGVPRPHPAELLTAKAFSIAYAKTLTRNRAAGLGQRASPCLATGSSASASRSAPAGAPPAKEARALLAAALKGMKYVHILIFCVRV